MEERKISIEESKSVNKKKGKNKNKKENRKIQVLVYNPPAPEVRPAPPLSGTPIADPVLASQLHAGIEGAISELLTNITSECARRINSIKTSTMQAIAQISKLKNNLKHLLISQEFSEASINKLKDFPSEAFFYYRVQCEGFNLFIDKLVKDMQISENPDKFVVDSLKGPQLSSRWAVVKKNGEVKEFPFWINSQINSGVNSDADEIKIYKKSLLVSIADTKKMIYYGIVNGNRLLAQVLRKIS